MFTNVIQTHQNLHPRLQALIIVQLGTEKTQAKTRTKTKTPTSSKGSQVHIPIFGCRNVALHLIHIGESGKFLKKQPVT